MKDCSALVLCRNLLDSIVRATAEHDYGPSAATARDLCYELFMQSGLIVSH